VTTPSLNERREDIPLLVRRILALRAREVPDLESRFFEPGPQGKLEPRIEPALIEGLLQHDYTHHLRELERLVWLAISTSRDGYLARTREVEAQLRLPSDDGELTPDAIRAALAEQGGSVTKAAKRLGLKNRFALYRLMKEHKIEGVSDEDESS
jgi:two-component system nitrogen regulation response regulator GlnG/two-component system response regulator HydG